MSQDRKSALEPIGLAAALEALFVSAIRGGNQVALKFTLQSFTPFASAAGRMLLGSLVLSAWMKARGQRLLPEEGEIRRLLVLGLLFTVQIAILHHGADLTSPAYAVVMMNTNPIWASLLSHFFVPGDHLTPRRAVALCAAFAGILLVFLAQESSDLAPRPVMGNLLLLVSASMVAARTVYLQRVVQTVAPARAALWQMGLSVPCFAAGAGVESGFFRPPVAWPAVTGMLYQGVIVAGVGFSMWAHLLRRHSPAALSAFNFLVPFVGLFWAALLFGEELSSRLLLGLLVVSTAIYFAASGPTKREAPGKRLQ